MGVQLFGVGVGRGTWVFGHPQLNTILHLCAHAFRWLSLRRGSGPRCCSHYQLSEPTAAVIRPRHGGGGAPSAGTSKSPCQSYDTGIIYTLHAPIGGRRTPAPPYLAAGPALSEPRPRRRVAATDAIMARVRRAARRGGTRWAGPRAEQSDAPVFCMGCGRRDRLTQWAGELVNR